MGRRKDLDERLDLALGARRTRQWDPKISRALDERRRQFLNERAAPTADGDTAAIQRRLAAAREAED